MWKKYLLTTFCQTTVSTGREKTFSNYSVNQCNNFGRNVWKASSFKWKCQQLTHPQRTLSASSKFLCVFVRKVKKKKQPPVNLWHLITCKDVWAIVIQIFFIWQFSTKAARQSHVSSTFSPEIFKFTFGNQFILDTTEAISWLGNCNHCSFFTLRSQKQSTSLVDESDGLEILAF